MKINTGGFLFTSVLVISSVAIWAKANESHTRTVNVLVTSTVLPKGAPSSSTAIAIEPIPYDMGPYDPPLTCGVTQINPAEYEPRYNSAGCIAGWMLTWSDTCTECEGLSLWRASENYWTRDDFFGGYLYTYCFNYENDRFGQSPEQDTYFSLQLIFTPMGCNGEELDYRQEPAGGPLKFGDVGWRVKALQKALIEKVYLVDWDELGNADGIYGPLTTRAVMNFQYMSGLPTNGIADQRTFAELGLKFSFEKN
ncbi:MAG: peptidoglycan-binding protein [Actinobacteria bacterium]|nr:peptidoglycan-binding protein [Actinomycetota bacterium]